MTLDATTPDGLEIIRKLVANADIVIANMPETAMRAIGLDYDSRKAVKPDIILSMATAFDGSGPYNGRIGFDGIGQVDNAWHDRVRADIGVANAVAGFDDFAEQAQHVEVCGDGDADFEGNDKLNDEIRFDNGDASTFTAKKW